HSYGAKHIVQRERACGLQTRGSVRLLPKDKNGSAGDGKCGHCETERRPERYRTNSTLIQSKHNEWSEFRSDDEIKWKSIDIRWTLLTLPLPFARQPNLGRRPIYP